jgi:hypothetical protein
VRGPDHGAPALHGRLRAARGHGPVICLKNSKLNKTRKGVH